jgi:hypothetical protein
LEAIYPDFSTKHRFCLDRVFSLAIIHPKFIPAGNPVNHARRMPRSGKAEAKRGKFEEVRETRIREFVIYHQLLALGGN